ncbi:MAG TPA: hypothetical protein ENI15_00540 [Spirochaetes bacterium]|nr:hypothetical protein [Spirochaetota bacterium]
MPDFLVYFKLELIEQLFYRHMHLTPVTTTYIISMYVGLPKIGYAHEIIRDEADIGKNLLPKINRVVALLRRWLLGTCQGRVQPSHLDYYLDEFTFRFNRRTSNSCGKLFYRLVHQAVAIEPMLAKFIHGGTIAP